MSLFCLQALISLLLTLPYPLVSQQESETEIRSQDALQNAQENRLSSSLLPPVTLVVYQKWHRTVVSSKDAENHKPLPPPPPALTERRGNGGVKQIKSSPSNAAT